MMGSPASPTASRGPLDGVRNVIRFDWPYFVAAELVVIAGVVTATLLSPSLLALGIALLSVAAMFGIALSLLVSHIVYDRSDLYRLFWLPRALRGASPHDAVYCQIGFDDASMLFQRALGAVQWTFLDHYDPMQIRDTSTRRARKVYPPSATTKSAPFNAWPVESSSADVIVGMLAIHRLRGVDERAAWFAEARRVLRPGGRVLIIERVRDVANLIAFGPGALKLHSAAQWTASWHDTGLRLQDSFRVTPWVRVFVLHAPSRGDG